MKFAAAALVLMTLGAVGSWATIVEPTATLTLDSGQPVDFFGAELWDYTLTVSNGDLGDIQSFTIDNVGGLIGPGAFAPSSTGWSAAVSGNNVTFTNSPSLSNFGTTQDGFVLISSFGTSYSGTYTYTVGTFDPGGTVPVPGTATPEPASVGLAGLGLLAIVGARKRFASK